MCNKKPNIMKKLIYIVVCLLILAPLTINMSTREFSFKQPEKKKVKNYHTVKVTMYSTNAAETDDNPTETASGFIVDALNPAKHRIIAVSHDLKRIFKYGQKVRVEGVGKYSGVYYVMDLMHSRWKNKIDILINPGDKAISYNKAKLYKL
jgi:3D (Asp-Asp-Asp) domain-containing protein